MAYQINISKQVEDGLQNVIEYLLDKLTETDVINFVAAFDETLHYLSVNPYILPTLPQQLCHNKTPHPLTACGWRCRQPQPIPQHDKEHPHHLPTIIPPPLPCI